MQEQGQVPRPAQEQARAWDRLAQELVQVRPQVQVQGTQGLALWLLGRFVQQPRPEVRE